MTFLFETPSFVLIVLRGHIASVMTRQSRGLAFWCTFSGRGSNWVWSNGMNLCWNMTSQITKHFPTLAPWTLTMTLKGIAILTVKKTKLRFIELETCPRSVSGQCFDCSALPLTYTAYPWTQVILWQIGLCRAFHSIGDSYWTRTTQNGPCTGSLIAEGSAESRGLPRIQSSFAEAFLHERICCNVISPGCLAIAANSTSKRGSILTSCCHRSPAAGIPEQTSNRAVSLH